MTKEDIKKALVLCQDGRVSVCRDCPYTENCDGTQLFKDAFALITEQEKEIERLKAENEELTKVVSSKVYDLIDNAKEIADAREAWEQQAKIDVLNELKTKAFDKDAFNGWAGSTYVVLVKDIDELLKEYE